MLRHRKTAPSNLLQKSRKWLGRKKIAFLLVKKPKMAWRVLLRALSLQHV
jgi:hypothetical protein